MRLDLCLKSSGLIKRRTIAKYYCERGLVKLNSKTGKPSSEVKSGDVIDVTFGKRNISFKIELEMKGKVIHVTYEIISDVMIKGDA